jgi:molybdate transport system substrate-binding protein
MSLETMKTRFVSSLFAASLLLLSGTRSDAATVTVFAAASLTDSLRQIAADYEKTSGDTIVFNLAASGVLARQIESGAPADLFFSADEAKADGLQARGLLEASTRRSFLGNSLVIVTPLEAQTVGVPSDLTNATVKRVALGDVKMVPAGTYAREYLLKLGLWAAIEGRIVPCENVRAVLAAVESGNVEAGVVYRTDAIISKKVKVVFAVPVNDGPRITCPLAIVKDAPQAEAARKFLDHLSTPEALAVFTRSGFIILPESKTDQPVMTAGCRQTTQTAKASSVLVGVDE